MEEKYLKADEILGKIMVIFLADLGLRVSQSAQTSAKQPPLVSDQRCAPPASALAPVISAAPMISPKENDAKRWASQEAKLLNLRYEQSVPALLRRLKIDDLDSSIKTSQAFSNKGGVLASLNGSFEGRSNVSFDDKKRSWYIHIELAGTMEGKEKLSGNLKIRLLENGKVFSNSSNSGSIVAFREFLGGESQAILAKVSDGLYFQLYYLKELDQLAGNIYRRSSDVGNFEHIGSMSLKRAQ